MKLISLKNSKGQAFSTFQLLIAAVVALALLGVLMPIIGGINPAGGNITDSVKEKIKSNQDLPGTITLTESIKVSSKTQGTVATDAITDGSGMDPESVKFIVPSKYSSDFGVSSDGQILQIKKSERINYKFGVLCHRDAERLDNFITSSSSLSNNILSELDITESGFESTNSSRVCIVFPVKE